MKRLGFLLLTTVLLISCGNENISKEKNSSIKDLKKQLIGTWKLTYSEIRENDSIVIKDISNSDFIKIINNSHFAFISQPKNSEQGFYAGAGTYKINGSDYIESLDFIDNETFRGYIFPFTVEIKGDTLIQQGIEKIENTDIDRYIIEKYIRIKD